jgi:hypothetical protein
MSLFLGLAYILPGTAALTYWIDPQCDAKLSPPGTPVDTNPFRKRSALLMGEVIAAGKSGASRIDNDLDEDFSRAFNFIFNTNRYSTTHAGTIVDPGKKVKVKSHL